MEGIVCQFDKYGYCKYQMECKRKHFIETCRDDEKCESKKSCPKRHPKCCKRYATGTCRFEESCNYNHQKPAKTQDQEILSEKVQKLEEVINTLTKKVFSLVKEMKKKSDTSETVREPNQSNILNVK